MSKILLQTSKAKPSQNHIDQLMQYAQGWQYEHYDDAEIIEFFNKNPIPGFEKISERFYEIKRGEHRADLFRYYYLYLNGGFFVDFDFELTANLDEVVKSYSFICAEVKGWQFGAEGITNRSRFFNGYLYAEKNHPIIFQALTHLYNIDLEDLGPLDGSFDRRYHIVCEFLYHAAAANKDPNMKIYQEVVSSTAAIYDGDKVLGLHKQSVKENVVKKKDVVLMFCEMTAKTGFNSGIQRHVKKLAKALLDDGVQLIPIRLNSRNYFEMLTTEELERLAKFNGPSINDWGNLLNLSASQIRNKITKARIMLFPELPTLDGQLRTKRIISVARANGTKVVSTFHDAVAVVLKDHYSPTQRDNFLTYMKELSYSDMIISISESSKSDYNKIIESPLNKKAKHVSILTPHNINVDSSFSAKENTGKNINIVSVSSFETRKNHIVLLEAFKIAKEKLAAIGYTASLTLIAAYTANKQHNDKIVQLAKEVGADIKIGVSDQELLQAYKDADFSVYPSVYEGFGLPIVESLQAYTPVACSNTSSMKEVAALGGCVTFNPHNVDDIANAIFDLASNPEKRIALINEIKSIKPYSWKDYAADVMDAINKEL